jgi:periplasmic copper chaperone A
MQNRTLRAGTRAGTPSGTRSDGPRTGSGRGRRTATVGVLAAASVVLSAGPALAHVKVDPEHAPQGSSSVVNFRVPNERPDASTTKVEINLPTDHPLAYVTPQPVPGWKVKVHKTKLDKPITSHGEKITEAVTKITWSGGKIEPDRFQQFPVSMGPLPHNTDQLVFKALQTYDKGPVERWIEKQKKGQPEPENPAPTLKLTPAASEESGGAGKNASHDAGSSRSAADRGGDTTDTTARVLGIAGIVVGVAGVAFGLLARRRRSM